MGSGVAGCASTTSTSAASSGRTQARAATRAPLRFTAEATPAVRPGGPTAAQTPASPIEPASDATPIHPAAPATSDGCTPPPRTEFVRVSAVTESDGVFWLHGRVERIECGPDVPDDTQFVDVGPVRSFPMAATATYTLRGTDPVDDYAVSANTFMAVAQDTNTDPRLAWYEGVCELDFGPDGRVREVQGNYSP